MEDYKDILFKIERINLDLQKEKEKIFQYYYYNIEKKETEKFVNLGKVKLNTAIDLIPFLEKALLEIINTAPLLENFLRQEQVLKWINENEEGLVKFVFEIENLLGRELVKQEIDKIAYYRLLFFKIDLITEYFKATLFNQNLKVVFKETWIIKRTNKNQVYKENALIDEATLYDKIRKLKNKGFKHELFGKSIYEVKTYLETTSYFEVLKTIQEIDNLLDN